MLKKELFNKIAFCSHTLLQAGHKSAAGLGHMSKEKVGEYLQKWEWPGTIYFEIISVDISSSHAPNKKIKRIAIAEARGSKFLGSQKKGRVFLHQS